MMTHDKTRVAVDPSSRIFYASYYIQGLYDVFGEENVVFRKKPFSTLDRRAEPFAFEHYFAFIVFSETGATRYVVDFCDPPDISPIAYGWCDVYGKVNFNPSATSAAHLEKLRPLPPGFGIRIWGKAAAFQHAMANFLKCRMRPLRSIREHFRDYYITFQRPRLSDYLALRGKSDPNYVFLASTLWPDDEDTNLQRRIFLEKTKKHGMEVEGGFFADACNPNYETYKQWIYDVPYSATAAIGNMAKSAFVFNTPAVHGCFGWKLPEYLALGKAVISRPLGNTLRVPLQDGVHIHFVNDEKALREAISLLGHDGVYSQTLEKNAADYFDAVAAPAVVIQKLTGEK